MDTLPQELVDATVDILADDRRSLRALCSVSRSLRSRARVHFMRSVHLGSKRSVMAFHSLCLSSPDIPNLVQNLSVAGEPLRHFKRTGKSDAEPRMNLEELLLSHPLPNVQALRVELSSVYPGISEIPTPLLSYSLTSLTLRATFYSSSHLLQLLGCYPTLRRLDVSSTRVKCNTEGEQLDVDMALSIEDLTVCHNVLSYGQQLFAVHALRRIKLVSFWLPELHKYQRLLENPEGALQRLHISLPLWYNLGTVIPKLKMLNVPFLILEAHMNDKCAVTSVKWFIDCLESEQGRVTTSRINILLTPSGKLDGSFLERSVDEHIWTSLDSIMMAPRFAFTTLCIWVGYASVRYPRKPDADLLEITQRFICNALPGLRSANRLEVHCKILKDSFNEVMHLIG